MPLEPLNDFVPFNKAGDDAHLFTDIQRLRVLIYTDDDEKVKDNAEDDFGIGVMREFLHAHQPTFGKAEVVLVSRNDGPCEKGHAVELLTEERLRNYDQVWFFGIHPANLDKFAWPLIPFNRGGPKSELTAPEGRHLLERMSEAGVLVSGDHSEERTVGTTPIIQSLGRALGISVPRARELRKWDGGPTAERTESYNTQERNDTIPGLEDPALERDEIPQTLKLVRFDDEGKEDATGRPHDLFRDDDGGDIDVFPDHAHEGDVFIPAAFKDKWPAGGPPPVIAACGKDKRKENTFYNMVAAYDGDAGGVGRIVVDASWHHYFNANLLRFREDMSAGSVADRLGQYYRNLVIWLSPLSKRQAMARAMFWWLANHPRVNEEASAAPAQIGEVAARLLSRVASHSEIQQLLLAYSPLSLRERQPMLLYPAEASQQGSLPTRAQLLGSVLKRYYREPTPAFRGGISEDDRAEGINGVINAGFADAFSAAAQRPQS